MALDVYRRRGAGRVVLLPVVSRAGDAPLAGQERPRSRERWRCWRGSTAPITPPGKWPSFEQTLQVRKGRLADLLQPRMARIVVIGALLGIFSQISGANAVFTYAPVIFSQTATRNNNHQTAEAE